MQSLRDFLSIVADARYIIILYGHTILYYILYRMGSVQGLRGVQILHTYANYA